MTAASANKSPHWRTSPVTKTGQESYARFLGYRLLITVSRSGTHAWVERKRASANYTEPVAHTSWLRSDAQTLQAAREWCEQKAAELGANP